MKKIIDDKSRKVFLMERQGYKVEFTLLDMGIYVGHKQRAWYETPRQYWETMCIDVISQDPSKSISSEFLIDSYGKFQRLLISDKQGNKRIILPITPHYGIKEEDFERMYGKGIHKVGNSYIQEYYSVYNPDDIFDGTNYYFDSNTNSFIDDDGNKAPDGILTNLEIGNVLRKAAQEVSTKFRSNPNQMELEDYNMQCK